MHIQKFSNEAMREARYFSHYYNGDEAYRILLADVNAQLAAQTPAFAPGVSDATALRNALRDMRAGWRYIRQHHGDLPGVGWDRCEQSATKALQEPCFNNAPPEPAPNVTEALRRAIFDALGRPMGREVAEAAMRSLAKAGYTVARQEEPDATMQRVAEELSAGIKFAENYKRDHGISADVETVFVNVAVKLNLEILPAQPIRVVVKGEK